MQHQPVIAQIVQLGIGTTKCGVLEVKVAIPVIGSCSMALRVCCCKDSDQQDVGCLFMVYPVVTLSLVRREIESDRSLSLDVRQSVSLSRHRLTC